jgi:hypothetical protein
VIMRKIVIFLSQDQGPIQKGSMKENEAKNLALMSH